MYKTNNIMVSTDTYTREEIKELLDDMRGVVDENSPVCEDDKHISIKDIHDDFAFDTPNARKRKADAENFRKVTILKWNHNPESITIDDDGDVTCPAWGNWCIKGTGNDVQTVTMINRYIDECAKEKEMRNFDFIEIVEKLPDIFDDVITENQTGNKKQLPNPKLSKSFFEGLL